MAVLVAGGLGLAGFPVFGTAIGRAAIDSAAAAAGNWWAPLAVVVAAVLTAGAVFDLAWSAMPVPPRSSPRDLDGGGSSVGLIPVGVAVGLLAIALAAGALGGWAAKAANRFVDTAGYRHAVLGAPDVLPPRLPLAHATTIGLSSGNVVLDALTVVAAVAVAAALRWLRTAQPSFSLSRSAVGVVVGRLHDGAIGDSVTWAALGTAAMALIFAITLR